MSQKIPHTKFEKETRKLIEEVLTLLFNKRKDYGPNALRGGRIGIAIRMSDKQARLENLLGITDNTFKPKKTNVRESTEDTVKDILNYALLYLMSDK